MAAPGATDPCGSATLISGLIVLPVPADRALTFSQLAEPRHDCRTI